MFTMAMPPVIQPTSELARSISFSDMPPLPIRQPIVMKNGTAIREKELMPFTISLHSRARFVPLTSMHPMDAMATA